MFIDVQEKLESTEYGVFLFLLQEKNYFTGINWDLLVIIEFNYAVEIICLLFIIIRMIVNDPFTSTGNLFYWLKIMMIGFFD